ncbi:MAG: hypothetical protein WCF90_06475 [Methanomicrobiales archaeon]
MKNSRIFLILLAVICIALITAGCTSSKTATPATTTKPAATPTAASSPADASATPVPATTISPETNGVGILQGSWDNQATGISTCIDPYVK